MPNVSLSGVRVLVVEDEMMVSMLLEDMLSDIGCTAVGPATRVERALKLIENAGFDVAILDVNLNGDETYPVADALAARAIPFVFASGYGAGRLREEYRSTPSLQKPFQQQELERTLAAALGGKPDRPAKTGEAAAPEAAEILSGFIKGLAQPKCGILSGSSKSAKRVEQWNPSKS